MANPGGVLVLQTAFLGDVVLTTPLLRELKRVHASRPLTVVATPLSCEILAGLPFIDRVVAFDKAGKDAGPFGTWRLASALRLERPAVAVAAQRSFRTGLLALFSGAPLRVGWSGASGGFAYTARVPWRAEDHAVQRYLALAGPAGGDPAHADLRPEIHVSDAQRERAATRLRDAGVSDAPARLALAPGSIWGTKRWTPAGYAEVARAARGRGLAVVLLGSKGERSLCEQIAAEAGGGLVLAGELPLPETAAVLASCSALIANDSGLGHVASAVDVPVVTIFGPTVPAFGYAPYGERNRVVQHEALACRPCHRHGPEVCPLGHHHCMVELPAARVLATLDEVLAARAGA